MTRQTLQAMLNRVAKKWIPPENRPTLEWLDQEFVLPPESGDLHGKYNIDYVPYFWGVSYMMDSPTCRVLSLMKAAQIGWTFFLVGFLGKRMECQPGNIMVLFPKEGAATSFSEEKLVPAIRSTSAMSRLVDVSKARKDGQRALFKKFPGGFLKMVGSNSASNVKSTPAQLVIAEEPDDTSENVKDQGDALRLVRERLKRQRSGKLFLGGTPSVKDVSRVEEFVKMSDRASLPIRCHDCGEKHVLNWDNVSWGERTDNVTHTVYGKSDPTTAIYACPHCGSIWDDWQRKKNIYDTVKAAADAGDPYCGWEFESTPTNGAFIGVENLSELYVCIPGTSLGDVVRDYLEAEYEAEHGDESGRIVFTNSKLALPYEYKSDTPEADELSERAETYDEYTVPHGGLILTAGVDVQHDRLAITIWAWGRGEEMWLVYWGEIAAKNTTVDVNDPVWDELDQLLFRPYKHAAGWQMHITATAVDSSDGQTNDAVYDFVRHRQKRGVMAVKGSSNDYGTREIFSLPKKVDPKSKTKVSKYGLRTFIVGTFKAKELLIGNKGRITLTGNGPGRMHFYKTVRADIYDQLVSEVLVPHRLNRRKLAWQVKSGVRNEGLDCTVMALHAARSVKTHSMSPAAWDALEAKLQQADMFSELPVHETEKTKTSKAQKTSQPPQRRRRGNYVNNW